MFPEVSLTDTSACDEERLMTQSRMRSQSGAGIGTRRVQKFLLGAVAAAVIVASSVIGTAAPAQAVTPSGISALAQANVGKGAGSCSRVNNSPNSLGGGSFYGSCIPEYWCADFAKWVWANNGVNVSGITAGAASFITAAGSNGSTVHQSASYTPQVGDAAVFNWNGAGSADHVGLVVQVNPGGSLVLANGDFNGSGSGANWVVTAKVVDGTISAGNAHAGGSGFGMTLSAFVTPNGLGASGGTSAPTPNTYPTLASANIRSAPSTAASLVNTVGQGTELTIDCYENGTTVSGTSIWDHLGSGGFISDSLLYTGSANPVVSACSTPSNTYRTFENGTVRVLSSELAAPVSGAPAGTQLTIDCYVTGEVVEGTTVWDHVTSGGFISDAHMLTGSANAVVPGCPAGILHGPFPTFENATVFTQPNGQATVVASYGVGQYLSVDCYLTGPTVNGTNIWDHIAGLGFVNDSVVLTGSATPVVSTCQLSQLAPVPSITGAAADGSVLSVSPGEWSPAPVSLSYQWLADGSPIPGATGSDLRLTSSQVGTTVSVAVTGAAAGLASFTSTSAPTSQVLPQALSTSSTPTLTGSSRVGGQLTAQAGYWSAPVAPTYQWFANSSPIAAATHSTLTVPASAAGKRITVQVSRSNGAGGQSTLSSAPTPVIALGSFAAAPKPKLSGISSVGHQLRATPGTWKPAGVTLSYQWFSDGTAIRGATKTTWLLQAVQRGHHISCRVTGRLAGYKTVSEQSASTVAIH